MRKFKEDIRLGGISKLTAAKGALACALFFSFAAGAANSQTKPAVWFNDDFTDLTTSSLLWQTQYITSGVRWYPYNDVNQHYAYSSLEGPPSPITPQTTWQNFTTSGASATYSQGTLTFSAAGSLIYPYIWQGPPYNTTLFPPTTGSGFTLTVGLRVPSFAINGVGLTAQYWSSTTPTVGSGNAPRPGVFDPPTQTGTPCIQMWADNDHGGSNGGPEIGLAIPGFSYNINTTNNPQWLTTLNTYKVVGTVSGGLANYTLSVYSTYSKTWTTLGSSTGQPISTWPNSIWLGNPAYQYWEDGSTPWTSLQFDFVRITSP